MYDVMRFWLRRGVDGFRVDVLWLLIKDEQLRDNPPNPGRAPSGRPTYDSLLPVYTSDRPEVHDIVAEMRGVLDEHGERVLIGEIYLPLDRLVHYYGSTPHRSAHLPFNFQLLDTPWRADLVAQAVAGYEALLPETAWPNWVLGNHDQPRIASRVGEAQARVAAMLLLTLRGTPTIYQGDEIGLMDVDVPEALQRDPARHEGRGRDPQRTPMRWDPTPGAGFSTGEPWLPIGPRRPGDSVAEQLGVAGSMLELHRRLLELRGREPALALGSYRQLTVEQGALAYVRQLGERRLGIVLNLTPEPVALELPELAGGRVLVGTHLDRDGVRLEGRLPLAGNEGFVAELA
jgi:alpha-glucosidase